MEIKETDETTRLCVKQFSHPENIVKFYLNNNFFFIIPMPGHLNTYNSQPLLQTQIKFAIVLDKHFKLQQDFDKQIKITSAFQ